VRNFAVTRGRVFGAQVAAAQPSAQRPTFGDTLLLPSGVTENRVTGRTEGLPTGCVVDYPIGGPSQGGQEHFVSSMAQLNTALSQVALTTTHDVIVITGDFTVTVTKSLPPRPTNACKCDIVSAAVYAGTFGKAHGERVGQNEPGLATLTRELIWDGTLPAPGDPVGGIPKQGVNMFDLGEYGGVFTDRTSGYRFIGIKFIPHPSENRIRGYFMSMGQAGSGQNNVTKESRGIIFDRCVFDGGTTQCKGALLMACRESAVIGCWIGNWFSFDVDRLGDQAGWAVGDQRRWTWADVVGLIFANSSGSNYVYNNYLDSTGENLFFGGLSQSIGRNMENTVVRKNWLRKDKAFYDSMALLAGGAISGGTVNDITTKNLWECKTGLYFVIEDNYFEKSYDSDGGGQTGAAWVPKNNSYGSAGHDPQAGHILFRGNIVDDFQIALAPLGFTAANDASAVASDYVKEVHIVDNLFKNWNGTPFGSPRIYQQSDQVGRIYWDHNTVYSASSLTDGKVVVFDSTMTTPTKPVDRLDWTNNICGWGEWGTNGGVSRGGGPNGDAALAAVCTAYSFTGNAFMYGVSGTPSGYPTGNVYVSAWTGIYDSADIASEVFRPSASWADRLASDGWTKGISDWDHFIARLSGVNS
jgi:hypothetical protein